MSKAAKLAETSYALQIDKDGNYVAFTLEEPLFCFIRPTLGEIEELVSNTLASYRKAFPQARPRPQ